MITTTTTWFTWLALNEEIEALSVWRCSFTHLLRISTSELGKHFFTQQFAPTDLTLLCLKGVSSFLSLLSLEVSHSSTFSERVTVIVLTNIDANSSIDPWMVSMKLQKNSDFFTSAGILESSPCPVQLAMLFTFPSGPMQVHLTKEVKDWTSVCVDGKNGTGCIVDWRVIIELTPLLQTTRSSCAL